MFLWVQLSWNIICVFLLGYGYLVFKFGKNGLVVFIIFGNGG